MKRRTALKFVAALALSTSLATGAVSAETIKIGAAAPKTGPLAGGAAVSQWPNVQLWAAQVNERGGINVGGTMMPVEIIEYDDQTNPGETIKAIQRLATQDEVHFIVSPYGTGLVVAAAPIFARYGYPLIAVSAITDQQPALSKQFPDMFFTLGTTSALAEDTVKILTDMRDAGQLGNKIAMVNVADAFGIELADVARGKFSEAGFEIVYDTSYPLGTQDLSPVMKGAKAAAPDAFVAWSYPPDTFALTEQAQVSGLMDEVDVFYTAVANAFPAYRNRFGDSINGVFGVGGVNPEDPAFIEYKEAHMEVTGAEPDYWASAVMYSSLQVLEQAIEGVGTLDRQAVTEYLKNNSFDTVMGEWTFENQQINNYWTVGQWQDGDFYGLGSTEGMAGAADPM